MPDPGEPHLPEREDYETEADYDEAVYDHIRLMNPPEELEIQSEAIMGVVKLEQFLEENGER